MQLQREGKGKCGDSGWKREEGKGEEEGLKVGDKGKERKIWSREEEI